MTLPVQGDAMIRSIAVAAVVAVSCGAGCSTLKTEALVAKDPKGAGSSGSVTTWSSDKFAAVAIGDKACVMMPNRIVSLAAAGQTAAALSAGGPATGLNDSELKAGGAGSGRMNTAAAPAVMVSESTTLLNSALFYLCQMSANASVQEPQLTTLIMAVLGVAGHVAEEQIRAGARRPVTMTNVSMDAAGVEPMKTNEEDEASRELAAQE